VTLTLSLSSAPALPWTVVVSTVNGSATAGSDYTSFSETVSFGYGVTTKTVSIGSLEDSLAEDNETFWVRLDNASVSSVNITDNATVTITDDEARPSVSLSSSASTVSEGAGTLTLTATQSLATGTATVVNLSISGNATLSSDYTIPSLSMTIPAGSLSANATITMVDDNVSEWTEMIVVDIDNVSGVSGVSENGTQQVNITLTDNEARPAVTLSTSTSTVAESSAGTVTLTATQSLAAATDAIISLSIAGTADNGSDYTISSSTITIPAGSLSGTATLTIINDSILDNGSETILVDISSVMGGNGATDNATQQTITITDDDVAAITIRDVTVAENVSGGKATLTLVLNNAVQGSFTVGLATVDGTATGGSDYTALSSATDNVTFAGNASENQTIEINITNDSDVEYSETFIISIGNSTNNLVNVSDNATVTITDDDAAVVTFVADVEITEGTGGGNTDATVTLRLDKAVSGGFTVDVSTTDGTATAGSDYTALDPTSTSSGRATFTGSAGETQSVSFAITRDSIVEDNETIFISMGNVSNDLVTITDNATVTIVNDDTATVTLSTQNNTNEGDNSTVTLSVDNEVQGGFTVTLATTDGTATAGSDYTALNSTTGLASFTGNASESQTVTISTIDDDVVESIHETLIVSGISNNSNVTVGGNATITLVNDDKGTVTISVDNATVTAGQTATVYLTLDKAVPTSFDVGVAVLAGGNTGYSAQSNKINNPSPSSVTFAGSVGESKTITIGTSTGGSGTFGIEISLDGCTGSCDWADYVSIGGNQTMTFQ